MATVSSSDLVVLRHERPVTVAALRLVLDLERRGLSFALDGPGVTVRPGRLLTPGDREALGKHREDVKAIVRSVDRVLAEREHQ